MNLDLTEYVRAYEEKDPSLKEDEREIREKLQEKQKVADEIPQFITLGMFSIKLESINRALLAKYDHLIRMIMSLIAEKAAAKSKIVIAKYATIHERLKVHPTTIEEIAELEEFIAEIPRETEQIRATIEEMLAQVCLHVSIRSWSWWCWSWQRMPTSAAQTLTPLSWRRSLRCWMSLRSS